MRKISKTMRKISKTNKMNKFITQIYIKVLISKANKYKS